MADHYESPPSPPPTDRLPLGRRPLATTLWCASGVLVAVAVVAAARLGIRVAEERVPPTTVGPATGHRVGAELTVSGTAEVPVVLATEPRELRAYYFRESSIPGTGLEGITDERILEHRGTLGVRVAEVDLGLIRVIIVSGPRVGETFWMEDPPTPE